MTTHWSTARFYFQVTFLFHQSFGEFSFELPIVPVICVLGTKAYMPPEFVRFGWYDGSQSTVWALGMILVNLLSSSMAFRKAEKALSRSPRLKANLSQGITMVTSPAAFLTSLWSRSRQRSRWLDRTSPQKPWQMTQLNLTEVTHCEYYVKLHENNL